jgi:beta-glucosidase
MISKWKVPQRVPKSLHHIQPLQPEAVRKGKESVLCYISDLYRIITPEVKILKIELNPGESAKVSFKLSVDDLTFYGVDNERTLEDGTIEVHIGDLTASFEVVDSDKWNTI